jgi:anaerobic magnesium-protoporphyrin IX monomethyl ester cyclase
LNVVLVYANTYPMMAPPPVGLSLLVKPLERAGHTVRVVDLMKVKDPDAVLSAGLAEAHPDIVGFSMRNLDTQVASDPHSFVPDYVRWVGIASKAAPTIIGGSAVMSAPEALLERTGATYAMVGQGDQALPVFLGELAAGATRDFTAPGLIWRQDGGLRRNPGVFSGYGHDGSINWDVIDHRRYRASFNNCCVITKTGCAHRCVFCDAAASFGPAFVPRAPEAIVEDLRRDAVERGFHRLDYFFIDALFNEPLDWAKRVLEALVRFEHRIQFYAVIEPTASLDAELAALLRRAGCAMTTALVGSWDDDVLARSRRPFDVAEGRAALAHLERAGVPYMLYYMLGGPGETRESVVRTVDHHRRIRPIFTYASAGMRVLPRAGLREIAVAEGVVDPDDDLLMPRFYVSPALSGHEQWLEKQVARLSRPSLAILTQSARLMAQSIRVRFQ